MKINFSTKSAFSPWRKKKSKKKLLSFKSSTPFFEKNKKQKHSTNKNLYKLYKVLLKCTINKEVANNLTNSSII